MKALQPRRIDLYQSFFEKAPITRTQEQRIATVLLPVLLLFVMGGYYAYLELKIYNLNREIAPVATYLNTVDTQTLHQRADALQIEDDRLTAIAKTLMSLDAAADSYPHLDKDMLAAIYAQANDTITVTGLSYSSDTGSLAITLETPLPESEQGYLQRLRMSGYFSEVVHTGYSSTSGETPVASLDGNVYSIEISATLPQPQEVAP